jgi:hypothetical protein
MFNVWTIASVLYNSNYGDVTGLNNEFLPLLLVLISEFFTVLKIYQCVKECTHLQINFG